MSCSSIQKTSARGDAIALNAACINWDVTKASAPTALLQRSFELALFILPKRPIALEIVAGALEKIALQCRREAKRFYWRDKHPEHPVRRITRKDVDLLQWLIMFEAEKHEVQQEQDGPVSQRDMAIRYIKHLVQITTAASSFYVNIGVARILHNYQTSEAQRAYEQLTQRFLGPDEYRRAKAILMERVNQRFGAFLRLKRIQRGELRFESAEAQREWVELANECLSAFSPWSSQGRCATASDATFFEGGSGGDNKDQNEAELRCCHFLLDPRCYTQLMKTVAANPPETQLDLPRFFMSEKQHENRDGYALTGQPPELSGEDIRRIQEQLEQRDARRRRANPRFVTVLIDGVPYAQVDLYEDKHCETPLGAGASLVEIRSKDQSGDLVLATHFISFANNMFAFSSGRAKVGKGFARLTVTPLTGSPNQPQATLSLDYSPRFQWRRFWIVRNMRADRWRAARSFALTGLAAAMLTGVLVSAFYSRRIAFLDREFHQAQGQQQATQSAGRLLSYTLTRDESRVRTNIGADYPAISLRSRPIAIVLALPVAPAGVGYRYSIELKTFADDRIVMTANNLVASQSKSGPSVSVVIPASLLSPNTYYTVHLRAGDLVQHFTFRAAADE